MPPKRWMNDATADGGRKHGLVNDSRPSLAKTLSTSLDAGEIRMETGQGYIIRQWQGVTTKIALSLTKREKKPP